MWGHPMERNLIRTPRRCFHRLRLADEYADRYLDQVCDHQRASWLADMFPKLGRRVTADNLPTGGRQPRQAATALGPITSRERSGWVRNRSDDGFVWH